VMARVRALSALALNELDEAVREIEAMPAGTHVMMSEFQDAIAVRARALVAGLTEVEGSAAAKPVIAAASEPTAPAKKARKAQRGSKT
jgi:formylmethanofuran:tetrahydromethanopterin formyltransferase